jgi:hypothetical protein
MDSGNSTNDPWSQYQDNSSRPLQAWAITITYIVFTWLSLTEKYKNGVDPTDPTVYFPFLLFVGIPVVGLIVFSAFETMRWLRND